MPSVPRHLELHPPLVNGSGLLCFLEVFQHLDRQRAALGGYVTKSIGPEGRPGNVAPVVYDTGHVMLNSLALPTQPIESWIEDFRSLPVQKPVIGSVYGNRVEEWPEVISRVEAYVAGIELNLGCPNYVPGETSLMTVVGDSPAMMREVVGLARAATAKPLIAKLSPNTDYLAAARIALDAGADYLGCGNTAGPGLAIDIEAARPVLSGISGGLSGDAMRPVNVKMVYDIYREFRAPILAYGGVSTWRDAVEYLMAGARIVGLGTCFAYRSTRQMARLTRQIWEGMQRFAGSRDVTHLVGAAHV